MVLDELYTDMKSYNHFLKTEVSPDDVCSSHHYHTEDG
jgi:hypothetical protein